MAASGVAPAQVVPASQTVAAADPLASYTEVAEAGKPKDICNYCYREGHSAYRCYKNRRDKRPGTATGGQARVVTINLKRILHILGSRQHHAKHPVLPGATLTRVPSLIARSTRVGDTRLMTASE